MALLFVRHVQEPGLSNAKHNNHAIQQRLAGKDTSTAENKLQDGCVVAETSDARNPAGNAALNRKGYFFQYPQAIR